MDAAHRALLRSRGCATADRLVGRTDPTAEGLPPLLAGDRALPPGFTEWMVHPGYADPGTGSRYDAEREQDLALVLRPAGQLRRRPGAPGTQPSAPAPSCIAPVGEGEAGVGEDSLLGVASATAAS